MSNKLAYLLSQDGLDGLQPGLHDLILQFMGYDLENGNRATIKVSDGKNSCKAFVSNAVKQMILKSQIQPLSLVIVKGSYTKFINSATFIIIHMKKLIAKVDQVLGTPKELSLSQPQLLNETSSDQNRTTNDNLSGSHGFPETSWAVDPAGFSNSPTDMFGINTTPSNVFTIQTIESLNVDSRCWKIKAKILRKTEIINYHSGERFSALLSDPSGEIRAVGFNDDCHRLHALLEENKVYCISGGNIKHKSKDYDSTLHPCSIEFNWQTNVVPVPSFEDTSNYPDVCFNFTRIDRIQMMTEPACLDVIGVVKSCTRGETPRKRSKKQELTIVDVSKGEIMLQLWDDNAELKIRLGQIVAAKSVKLTNYKRQSLSTTSETIIRIEPNLVDTNLLRDWYESAGQDETTTQLTSTPENSSDFTHNLKVGVIVDVSERYPLYQACPKPDCRKKVVSENGLHYCPKCCESSAGFKLQFKLLIKVSTFPEEFWFTCFNDVAEKLLGKQPDEVDYLWNHSPSDYFTILKNLKLKCFEFRVKSNATFSQSKSFVVDNVEPVNYQDYSHHLLSELHRSFS